MDDLENPIQTSLSHVQIYFGKVFSAQQVLRESHAGLARTQTMCF